jgi:hypothetical protein
MTVSSGLRGRPNPSSQANGAMMRISPLEIFGTGYPLDKVAEWSRRRASRRLCPTAGVGPDGIPQRPVAAPACPEPGGSCGAHRHARRRHRHQRGHLWRASRRCVGPGRDSRPMDRVRAELPPCGRTTACAPSSSGVLLAGGCIGAGGAVGIFQWCGHPRESGNCIMKPISDRQQ